MKSIYSLLLFFILLIIQIIFEIPLIASFLALVILGLIFWLCTYMYSELKPSITKKEAQKIKSNLKVDNKKWRRLSKEKKFELYYYSNKQTEIIEKEINSKTYITKLDESIIRLEIEKRWEDLSLEERIVIIDKFELGEQRAKEYFKKLREDEKKRNKILEEQKEKEQKEKELRIQLENREIEKKRLQELEIARVKQKELEEIHRLKLIEDQKKQKDIRLKEKIKQEILEKERKRELESEAINELMEMGLLSDKYLNQYKRITIPTDVKEIVWKRDMQSCVSCGSRENLEFDHIIPVSKSLLSHCS